MLPNPKKWLKAAWDSPTLTTWLSLMTSTLGGVLVLPLVLRALSPAEVAVWYLFATIIGLNTLLDVGLTPTISRFVAYSMAASNGGGVEGESQASIPLSELFAAMRTVYLYLGLVAAVLMALWGTWGLSVPMTRLNAPISGYLLWALIVALSPIAFANNVRMAFLNGAGFIAVVRRWDAIFNLLSIASSIVVVQRGFGLVGLVVANQFWFCINSIRLRAILRRCLPRDVLKARINFVDARRVFSSIWPSSWRSGAGSLLYTAAQESSGLIYARFGSEKSLATYLLGLQVLRVVRASSMAPLYTKLPTLAKLNAEGKVADMMETAGTGMKRAYWTFVIGAAGAGIAGPWLLHEIGSSTFFPSGWLWCAMVAAAFLERFGGMHQNVLIAANHVVTHKASAGFLLIYIVAMAVLARPMGVYAFPLAMLIGHASFFSWYSGYHGYQMLESGFFKFESRCFLPALAAMIVVCLFLGFLGDPIRASLTGMVQRLPRFGQ